MKTLLTLFSKERSELQTEIEQATSLERVAMIVQNRLDGLEKVYVGDLSVAQVRLAQFLLETLRQSLATLTAAKETELQDSTPPEAINKVTRPNRLLLKLLQALICVGIFGSLFSLTRTTPGNWMVILLMSLLVGLEVALQLDKDNQEKMSSPQPAALPSAQVDSTAFLDNLASALNSIDLAVAQAEEIRKPFGSSGNVEDMPEVLDFLQKLWGASCLENPQMTIELTKLIPQILIGQGIRVQSYRPDDEHSVREYFEFEPSIDRSAKEYVTIMPALFKGDRLLRRGRVIEPAYSQVN